ncbi:MAG TPA: uroporphyrinogen decarboxylase family protein [Spirochaetia bacterium]|nr:uroporphyrinogen decarboxylase family protein [Spirochaetia bacterium]
MTSRERVRTALRHEEPDRVPVDNNGFVSSIHEAAYRNLLEHLGRTEAISILDPVQRIVLASEEVMCALGVDTRYIYPNAPSSWRYQENPDGTWKDEWGTTFRRLDLYADPVGPVLRDKDLAAIKRYRPPDPVHSSRFAGVRDHARRLYETTDWALAAGPIFCIDYVRWVLRGLEQSIADLYENPPIAEYLLDEIVDWMSAHGGALLDEIGDLVDVFWVGDDWGAQQCPFYSPEMFRRVFKPRVKKLISSLKRHTKARCAYHCCGSVYWAMEDLLECGVDILHPLQPSAAGNGDSPKIKRDFGKRLSFHGGTNNQGLFHGDRRAMEIDTLGRLRDLAPGGGYIFSSGHNIQANMRPENLLAFFRVAREYGAYPIDTARIDARMEELARGE